MTNLENSLISNFLGDLISSKELDGRSKIIEVVRRTAEIPWGEGRTIEEVLDTKKVGTCTGKHLVLQACFDKIEVRYQTVVCTFKWGDQTILLPENLKNILREGEWEHGHNFIQIKNEKEQWIDADVTWNSKLKPYGFETFPLAWDGQTSFVGVRNIISKWEGRNIAEMKKELIESLSKEMRERRENFLKGFVEWVASINK
ncbi:MAG: hypothetical protein OEV37_02845 [Candidatus Berkelbacteria bacterium]|nr:hypothetical protein [Candidatus Berkelbacteria bacterium]